MTQKVEDIISQEYYNYLEIAISSFKLKEDIQILSQIIH
jgi:hypothetical protein